MSCNDVCMWADHDGSTEFYNSAVRRAAKDYRCEEWGCTEEELKAAVAIVGNVSADVLAQLRRTGRKRKAPLSLDSSR